VAVGHRLLVAACYIIREEIVNLQLAAIKSFGLQARVV
jgi:hypothetical protein